MTIVLVKYVVGPRPLDGRGVFVEVGGGGVEWGGVGWSGVGHVLTFM